MPVSRIKHRDGFSLVELTIALAIFSTGLGSFSLLMMMAIQETAASHLQTVAIMQMDSLAESVRLNSGSVDGFLVPAASPGCLEGLACPDRMAGATVHQWQRQLSRQLPGGSGLLCRDSTPRDGKRADPACDGSGGLVIKAFWEESGRKGEAGVIERRVTRMVPLL